MKALMSDKLRNMLYTKSVEIIKILGGDMNTRQELNEVVHELKQENADQLKALDRIIELIDVEIASFEEAVETGNSPIDYVRGRYDLARALDRLLFSKE